MGPNSSLKEIARSCEKLVLGKDHGQNMANRPYCLLLEPKVLSAWGNYSGMRAHRLFCKLEAFVPTFFLLFLCLLCSAPQTARAQITVDSVIVHFGASERPVHNVIVGNSSNNPAYVKIEAVAVVEPEKSEKVVPTGELLASPKTFSIEPNGQRTVRLLLKSPPTDKERVFRVSFIPQDRGFGEEVVQNKDGIKTIIKVLTGMGILVFADPIKPVEDLQWERVGNKIIFSNTGNVNIYLGEGQSCSPAGVCSKIPSKRLYASNKLEVISPLENTVSILSKAGGSGGYRKISIPPGLAGSQSLVSEGEAK